MEVCCVISRHHFCIICCIVDISFIVTSFHCPHNLVVVGESPCLRIILKTIRDTWIKSSIVYIEFTMISLRMRIWNVINTLGASGFKFLSATEYHRHLSTCALVCHIRICNGIFFLENVSIDNTLAKRFVLCEYLEKPNSFRKVISRLIVCKAHCKY